MQDIKINFNGESDTLIDLTAKVEGKSLYEQKCLVNLATKKGSDPVYPARGTDLMEGAIGGLVISTNDGAHLANFAAIDTLFFVSEQEYAVNANSPDLVDDINVSIVSYEPERSRINIGVQFDFADETTTATVTAMDIPADELLT